MKYRVIVPPTAEQGSYKTVVSSQSHFQTYRAQALQDYNSCRAHDGLDPVSRMPAGTLYFPIVEFVLQGDYGYGHGWEDLCAEDTRKEARERLREYRENEGGTYRIVRRATEPQKQGEKTVMGYFQVSCQLLAIWLNKCSFFP